MRQNDWPFCHIIILKLYNLHCFVPLPSLDSCLDSFDWTTESESINENSASSFSLFCMEASDDEDSLDCMLLTQPRCSDWWQHPAVSARPSNRPRLPRAWPPLEETPHETIPRLHKRKEEMRSIEVIYQQARKCNFFSISFWRQMVRGRRRLCFCELWNSVVWNTIFLV